MDGAGFGSREHSPTGHGVLQGEVQFLKSALIRTEGNNRRLEKELLDFKTEFADLMATLKGTAGSKGGDSGAGGGSGGLVDRHTAEVKIEEWVHQLFGDTTSGVSYDAVMEAGSFGMDNAVAKVILDADIDDVAADADLQKLLDSMGVDHLLEDSDEDQEI